MSTNYGNSAYFHSSDKFGTNFARSDVRPSRLDIMSRVRALNAAASGSATDILVSRPYTKKQTVFMFEGRKFCGKFEKGQAYKENGDLLNGVLTRKDSGGKLYTLEYKNGVFQKMLIKELNGQTVTNSIKYDDLGGKIIEKIINKTNGRREIFINNKLKQLIYFDKVMGWTTTTFK